MATAFVAPGARPANPSLLPFRAALSAVRSAHRGLELNSTHGLGRLYLGAVDRLVRTPAPDIAALAEKIAVSDPMSLEHHAEILADARRLAGR